ncbi:MAG: hypothetical protein COZ96_11740 [Nitrospirae bacterium CG_4_8_14_3_um_filter_70_85]|nr:MAG: hypothetical protein COZ96_11740 [Nitrospirae bacterium CG_4_8_14_3_um_filter_70_85]
MHRGGERECSPLPHAGRGHPRGPAGPWGRSSPKSGPAAGCGWGGGGPGPAVGCGWGGGGPGPAAGCGWGGGGPGPAAGCGWGGGGFGPAAGCGWEGVAPEGGGGRGRPARRGRRLPTAGALCLAPTRPPPPGFP